MSLLKFAGALVLPCMIASAQSSNATQAEALVKQAISYAKTNGLEKLFQEVNNGGGKFHVASGGSLYVWVYDDKGVVKAIGYNTAALVGKNRMTSTTPDGKFWVKEALAVAKKGKGWYEYQYPDPVDNKIRVKRSYIEGYQGLAIGSGFYKD